MAKSTSQRDFFGTSGMHCMANLSTTVFDETPEDLFHDYHLDLQERIRNPIAFHAEMMGDMAIKIASISRVFFVAIDFVVGYNHKLKTMLWL